MNVRMSVLMSVFQRLETDEGACTRLCVRMNVCTRHADLIDCASNLARESPVFVSALWIFFVLFFFLLYSFFAFTVAALTQFAIRCSFVAT